MVVMRSDRITIERGRKIRGLTPLSPVLRRWQKVMEELLDDFKPDDVPWWYNERAWVGVLAAATWKAGGRIMH